MKVKEEYKYGEQLGNAIYLFEVDNMMKHRKAMFKCKCGKKFISYVHKIKTFETQSCGCFQKEATSMCNKTHGLRQDILYSVWRSMKTRCYNIKNRQYKNYGGKGVFVCEEWKDNFIRFYNWAMDNGYSYGLQLDKDIIGDGKCYSPENCCFVTPKENSNKRTTSRYIEYNGSTKTISEWADYFGISLKNLYQRLSRGWSFEKCVSYGK